MSRQFADDPMEYFARSRVAMHTLPPDELAALQLAAARTRFAEQYGTLPVLRTMADEQGIDEIGDLDAAAPLLFPHTVYKSYPASLLLEGRFDLLTRWLSRLTTVDLSGLDTSRCDSIDAWLDLLDTRTEVRLAHSSGTSGSMSFVPHTAGQYRKLYQIVRLDVLPDGAWTGEHVDVVWPGHRLGRGGIDRHAAAMAEQIAGSPERFHTLHSGLLSADVMFLAGRVRAAAARGELDRLEIPEALVARRAEFAEAQRPGAMGQFAERLNDTLRGRRVASLSLWSTYYDLASTGVERGLEKVFAPDSVVFPGGGAKGTSLPDTWAEPVERFFGVPRLRHCYAMTEVIALNLLCDHRGYHIEPWVVLYVLDPETGRPLPRHGLQTGRAAFLDLTADVQWGGFVSGDQVTVAWNPCACGRTTPRLTMDIDRFSGPGGDDKITCAATPAAIEEALGMLNGSLS
ncbi:hypothetical protein AB0K48_56550 [Nonomuraea sp. NPDC055795]